jgi:phosphotransferase system HPr-like phosphotransfer protein
VKLNITVFNKPEVVAGFLVEVMKVAGFFRCRMAIANEVREGDALEDFAILDVNPGGATELEVTAQGDDSQRALEAVRYLMERRYSEGVYSLN